MSASTDMGNVSYVVPAIHPMFYIGSNEFNHTRGFTTATGKVMSEEEGGAGVWIIFPGQLLICPHSFVFKASGLLPNSDIGHV